MKSIYLLINLLIAKTYSFSPNNVFKSNFKDTNIKIYKSYIDQQNVKNIVFYTGGNSIIPGEIYNNFLKTLACNYFNVYVVTNNKQTNEILFDYLEENDQETIFVGHSTGCVNAIEESNDNKFVKKLILMDPVNNKNLFNIDPFSYIPFNNFFSNSERKNNLQLKYIKDVLLLNAEKSYEWSFFPSFNIPFIPAFAMSEEKIQDLNDNLNIKVLKSNDYGHSDILDSMYSDFMHKTISKGNEERSEKSMYQYYIWLSEKINNFIDKKEESSELLNNTSNKIININ